MQKQYRVEPPQKTYFFERKNGSTFACTEKEAWNCIRNKWFKLIGVSDGKVFAEATKEAVALHKEGKIAEAKTRLLKGQDDELEAARGHIEKPRNFERVDPSGNPFDMNQVFGGNKFF